MQRAIRFFACLTLVSISCWAAAALLAATPSDNPKSPRDKNRSAGDRGLSSLGQQRGQSPTMSYKELVADGRRAFERGQYELAEALARQAQSQDRPGPLRRLLAKDSAQKLLKDVADAKASKKADADRAWDEQQRAEQDPDYFYTTVDPQGDTEQKHAAAALLQQAQEHLQRGDTHGAYRLTMQAKSYNVRYAPGEQNPDDLLAAIAGLERRATVGAPDLVNPLADASGSPGHPYHATAPTRGNELGAVAPAGVTVPAYGEVVPEQHSFSATAYETELAQAATAASPIATAPPTPRAAPEHATRSEPQTTSEQRHAGELIKEARRAMAMARFDEARSLAQQAKLQRYAASSPRGDTPDVILHQIDEFQRIVAEGKSRFDRNHVLRQQHDWLVELASRLRDQGDLDLAASIAQQGVDLSVPVAGSGAITAGRLLAEIEHEIATGDGAATPGVIDPSSHDSTSEAAYSGAAATPSGRAPVPPARVPGERSQPDQTSAAGNSWDPQAADRTTPRDPYAAPSAEERAQAVRGEITTNDPGALYEHGVSAMRQGRHQDAIALFQRALVSESLDPRLRQRIQDNLTGLYAQATRREQGPVRQAAQQDEPFTEAPATGQLRADRMEAEATAALIEANRLQAEQPDEALATLNRAKTQLTAAGREHPRLLQLLRRVNERIAEIETYKEQNAPLLELREQNRLTEEEIRRAEEKKIAVQKELAELVDKFNQLMDERRFAEARRVAETAAAIAPEEPVTQTLVQRAEIQVNYEEAKERERQVRGTFVRTLNEADSSREVPVSDDFPMVFGPTWDDIVKRRQPGDDRYSTRTEAEQEIEAALRRTVTLKYDGTPLVAVLDDLKNQAGINLVIDQDALELEEVNPSTPVQIDVDGIMLKSALNLILEDVHLIYVIRDEVLKITNEARGRGELDTKVYPVGDLVLPIPNFTAGGPSLGTMLRQAMLGANSPLGGGPIAVGRPINNGATDVPMVAHNVLAQLNGGAGAPGGGPPGSGPAAWDFAAQTGYGAMGEALGNGGAANADFDSLMELIRETIEPDSWDDVGGPGSMEPFALNLSLIISQTEDVHDRIASLLEQLRRLLDLQLAVEVRFVTLTDNFFERIGIDFDFDIDDDQDTPFQTFGRADPTFTPNFTTPSQADAEADNPPRDLQDRDHLNGVTVGQSSPGIFSVDLDIPFRQNSFNLGVPTFGGFTADAGAEMGFAILSDIEAFFFINAAQADRRTNIVQAPKVVMFNGQSGIVADFTARPFLISVVPLIGAGSVGFTPLIQPVLTGAFVSVQGIISADRRYVRLTVLPFFIQLAEVFTFTTNLGAVGGGGGLIGGGGAATTIPVTLQLPSVAQTFVITTVNVPDGGTVLLGGVKRVNEGRTEAGVPVLNKLPYVNRLFKNVGTGRETQSLMLMVTPRIIIGEEEEALLGI